MIQKHALLKYKFLMTFLMEQKPDVAGEVRGMYIESMGRTLFLLFKAYYAQLNRLDLQVANKHDLIAIEETVSLAVAWHRRPPLPAPPRPANPPPPPP